jgi:signal peptidase I
MTRPALKSVRNFALAAFALALVPTCLRAYKITRASEAPTIVLGDKILVNRVAYVWSAPRRGEMIVLHFPDRPSFGPKRVIGIPGDTVEMIDNRVIVNGRMLPMRELNRADFNWVAPENRIGSVVAEEAGHLIAFTPGTPYDSHAPVHLGPGEFFLLGDNRDVSADCRIWGPLHADRFMGKVIYSPSRSR